ncbi:hypothetical protein P3X46_002726 [Hevea brasiliensis]|uniref:Ribosomal protein L18e/L15P domain-containing protein n=1 Tax=Hevea brasiliensis TaxID=3981 RepID=A0ABQ9N4P3_HEVBR|nr:hypothetical protein P3X46_002726 [Hevea brasiliensis]
MSVSHSCIRKHRKHPGGHANSGGMHHHRILLSNYLLGILGKIRLLRIMIPNAIQLGYLKVMGKLALLENQPIVVKAKLVLKIAGKKIKEASGVIILNFWNNDVLELFKRLFLL